jgi:subtilisin family serine protease
MTPPVSRARGAWLGAAAPALAALLALAACADPPHAPRPPGATPAPRAAKDGPAPDSADGYLVFLKPARADERRRRGSPDDAARAAVAADVARRARATTAQPLAFVDAAVLRGPVDVAALAADPRVARVAPNTLERKLGFPADALFWRRGWQWNLRQIEADAAAATGAGRTVCVVDGGVDPRHQDLAGKVALARAFPGATPYAADFDADGHGTHVAGTVTSNGIGAAAAAPGARLLNANVFGPDAATSVARVADAVAWCARSGADVINLSLGSPRARGSAAWAADSATYAAAAGDARALGAVVVAAAGNSGLAVPGPSAFLPAEAPGVLAVGATAPRTRFRPSAFARYSAASARANRSSTLSMRAAGKVATPMLAVMRSARSSSRGRNSCSSMRSRSARRRRPRRRRRSRGARRGTPRRRSAPPCRCCARRPAARGHVAQHRVAHQVAVRVVHALEVVEVDQQQRHRPS